MRIELRRLARGFALARARDLARRADVLLLAAAVLGAFVHRAIVPLPGFDWLLDAWWRPLVAVGALLLLRPLLRAFTRVAARPGHLFPAGLVASQFETLEVPTGEPGVLQLPAQLPPPDQLQTVLRWLAIALTEHHLA